MVPSLNQVVNYPIASFTNALAVADFNGDGKLDLAAAGEDTLSVLLGAGDGKFGAAQSFAIGTDTRAIDLAVGDFNGDGKLDLATANLGTANIALLSGNGDGTFRAAAHFAVGASPRSLAVGHFNSDGKLDLVTANAGDDNVSVLFGQGDGTFQPPFSFATGTGTDSVVTADFNGDGKLDLAVLLLTGGGSEGTDRRIAVLLGDGSGGFTPAAGEPFAFSNFSQAEALAVGA